MRPAGKGPAGVLRFGEPWSAELSLTTVPSTLPIPPFIVPKIDDARVISALVITHKCIIQSATRNIQTSLDLLFT